MLNLTRLHLGIAHESQFQGLGMSRRRRPENQCIIQKRDASRRAHRVLPRGPKVPYRRLVEVLGGVHVANIRIAVDHRPLKPSCETARASSSPAARTSWNATAAKPANRFGCAAKTCSARSSFIRFAVSTAIARSGMPLVGTPAEILALV